MECTKKQHDSKEDLKEYIGKNYSPKSFYISFLDRNVLYKPYTYDYFFKKLSAEIFLIQEIMKKKDKIKAIKDLFNN